MIHLLVDAIVDRLPENDLHNICKRLIESGVSHSILVDTVTSTFTKLNADEETYYDVLYDILDELEGFCPRNRTLNREY